MSITPPQVTGGRKEVEEEVRERISRAQAKQSKQYEHKVHDRVSFEPGNFVMLVNSRQTKGHVRSFEPKYVGPYLVLEKVNDVNFLIKDPESRRLSIVHYNRMVRYKTASETKSAVAEEELLNENAIDHRMIAQRVRRRRVAGRKEDENLPALEHEDQPGEEESETSGERSADGGFSALDGDDQ